MADSVGGTCTCPIPIGVEPSGPSRDCPLHGSGAATPVTATDAVALLDQLGALCDEREATARAATPGPWKQNSSGAGVILGRYDDPRDFVGAPIMFGTSSGTGDPGSQYDTAHIAANDPAVVLAECATYRDTLALVRGVIERHSPWMHRPCLGYCAERRAALDWVTAECERKGITP